MKFQPFPEITTERLVLRKIKDSDCDMVLYLRSDPEINKLIKRTKNEQTKTRQDALVFINKMNEEFAQNKSITWCITVKDNPEMIGTICLWNFSENHQVAEVGYDLHHSYQKKGIMREALQGVIKFGFITLSLDKITAITHKNNDNSKRLLLKNAFNHMPERRDSSNVDNFVFELKNTVE